MAEAADGKLALSKNTSSNVHAIAQQMITDHSAANAKLAAIAKSDGITPPVSPAAADKGIDGLQELTLCVAMTT
jgi:putative membrane protein